MRSCARHGSAVLTLIVCLLPFQSTVAQNQFNFEKQTRLLTPEQRFFLSSTPLHQVAYEGPQPFDMLHYHLNLRLSMVSDALQGSSAMTMRLKEPVDSLVLHAVGLALDTVRVDGVSKSTTMDSQQETFTIHLNGTRDAGDTLVVFVAYRRIQGYPRPTSRQGYYFFLDTLGLPSNLGYTFSEPSDARFWMPCYDEPWEKATADISITVPDGYVAASNGLLTHVIANGDGTRTWQWREQHQITTYLMCMTVMRFAKASLPYVRAPNDTVQLEYYTWQVDSSEVAAFLPTVAQMVDHFSALYGPYPFQKYGMTSVVPFVYLGMEHQTLTTMNRYFRTSERVVSHELAHQWWGDLVTCGTWRDIWLNESFATYSEALWREHTGGFPALRSYMKDTLEHFFFGSWLGAVYDPVGQGFNLFDDVVYSKGAWVLHTFRGVVGDSVFFDVLNAFRSRYGGKSAITTEFMAVADSVTGTDMSWFFNQWIFGSGWPEYGYTHEVVNDTAVVRIGQFQPAHWQTYRMPIRLRINYSDSTDTTVVVMDSLRLQTVRIPLARPLLNIEFDPDDWILKKTISWPLYVEEPELPHGFVLEQNYPNPFNPKTLIKYHVPNTVHVSLGVFDLLGREVTTLVDEENHPGSYGVIWDATAYPSGVYFYRLTVSTPHGSGNFTHTRKMILMK
jgi:aminopeptidase N